MAQLCYILSCHYGWNAEFEDFLPSVAPKPPKTPEEIEAQFTSYAHTHNAGIRPHG
jgi:hypothetical protein